MRVVSIPESVRNTPSSTCGNPALYLAMVRLLGSTLVEPLLEPSFVSRRWLAYQLREGVDEVRLVSEAEPERQGAPVHGATVLDLLERLVDAASLDDPLRSDAEEPLEASLQRPCADADVARDLLDPRHVGVGDDVVDGLVDGLGAPGAGATASWQDRLHAPDRLVPVAPAVAGPPAPRARGAAAAPPRQLARGPGPEEVGRGERLVGESRGGDRRERREA